MREGEGGQGRVKRNECVMRNKIRKGEERGRMKEVIKKERRGQEDVMVNDQWTYLSFSEWICVNTQFCPRMGSSGEEKPVTNGT